MCGCLSHTPYWGPGPQPRHVPWLGIEPVTLLFAGPSSIHLTTLARGDNVILFKKKNLSLSSCKRQFLSCYIHWHFKIKVTSVLKYLIQIPQVHHCEKQCIDKSLISKPEIWYYLFSLWNHMNIALSPQILG